MTSLMRRMVSGFHSKMARLNLSGICPPITTPFDAYGNIDFDNLQKNLKIWEQIDFKGYVVLGSNGEFPYLNEKEKLDLVKFVRDVSGPDKLVIAGAGCESTRGTIDLCNKFASTGADAVMVVTPSLIFKSRMTPSALQAHFTQVADASKLPVILYNVPPNTGVDMTAETVISLATHPNIIGLKDSSGEIPKFYRMVAETKDMDFQILVGSAGYLLPAIQAGCVGSVCALANCLGAEVVRLYKLCTSDSDKEEARLLQARLAAPNAAVTRKYGTPALKLIMDKLGLYGGPVRSPLQACTASEAQEVENTFKTYAFLT